MKKSNDYLFWMNIFLSSLPYYFVGILLLKQVGFTFTEIATLSVITELFGSVFDIPLSYVSNKIGYKNVLIISMIFLIIALSCLLFGNSKMVYLAAVFFGLSESLSSGVLNSYNFEVIDSDSEYKKFLGNLNTMKYIFVAMITIVSPYLLRIHYTYPIVISITLVFCSLLSLMRLPEIRKECSSEHNVFSYRYIKSISWHLVLLGVAFSTLIMISNSYAAVLLNEHGVPLDIIGVILFLFNLAMALGSYLNIRFEISLLLPFLAIFMFFQVNAIVQVVIFLMMRVLNSSYNNHFYSKFNTTVENNRVISWSIYNLFISISFMLSDFLAGIFADYFGIKSNYLIFGTASVLFLVYYLILDRKRIVSE